MRNYVEVGRGEKKINIAQDEGKRGCKEMNGRRVAKSIGRMNVKITRKSS